jgi:hypothetical protein
LMVTSLSRNQRCLDGPLSVDMTSSAAVELGRVLAVQSATELLLSLVAEGGWTASLADASTCSA